MEIHAQFMLVDAGFTLACRCGYAGQVVGFKMSAPVPYKTEEAFRRDYDEQVRKALADAGDELKTLVEHAATHCAECGATEKLWPVNPAGGYGQPEINVCEGCLNGDHAALVDRLLDVYDEESGNRLRAALGKLVVPANDPVIATAS